MGIGAPSVRAQDLYSLPKRIEFANGSFEVGDYRSAQREYRWLLEKQGMDPDSLRWMLARCSFRLSEYPTAFRELGFVSEGSAFSDYAKFARNWWLFDQREAEELRPFPTDFAAMFRDTASDLYDHVWLLAVADVADRKLWAVYDTMRPRHAIDDRLVNQALHSVHRLAEMRRYYRMKSPVVAGLLAVVPGGGLAYLGRWGQASVMFLTVGGFGLQSWEGFRRGSDLLGWGFLGIASGIYGVTIYNSVMQAQFMNRRIEENYAHHLRTEVSGVVRPYLDR